MAVREQEVERAYFVRKLNTAGSNLKRFGQVKREYMATFIGGAAPTVPLQQLEKLWMLKVIADAGLTPTNNNSPDDLWKQMVLSISQTPTAFVNQNKLTFYLNAS